MKRRRRANLLVAVNDVRVHAKIQCQRDHLRTERNRTSQLVGGGKKPGEEWVAAARLSEIKRQARWRWRFAASWYLEVAVRGGDMQRGEAVEERAAGEQRRAGAEGGGQAVEVARLRGAEEVDLLAGAAAAGAVPHRRRPGPPASGRGGGGGGTGLPS